MYPTVFVWQGGQLVSPSKLPQFNGTTGPQTQSIQITNNSDVTLIFALERATPVTILPRYRLTAPCIPNSQYNISMAAGSASSTDTTQYVTMTESPDATAFVLEPLNTDVTIIGGSVTITGTANVNVANTPAVTLTGSGNNVNIANTPTVNANVANATISGGTIDIQNVANGILSAAGNLRYLGPQSLGSTTTYTINALERALVIFTPSGDIIGGLTVLSHTAGPVYALQIANPVTSGVYVAYVNPAIDTQWDVVFGTSPGTSQGYVCADTGLPLMDIARLGQQLAVDSVPVVLASDQPGAPPATYSSVSFPAVGSQATVTFAGATGRRLVCRSIAASIQQTSTTPSVGSIVVRDGASGSGAILWGVDLAVDGTVPHLDRLALTGMSVGGTAGNNMTVEFTAGATGIGQTLSASVDLL